MMADGVNINAASVVSCDNYRAQVAAQICQMREETAELLQEIQDCQESIGEITHLLHVAVGVMGELRNKLDEDRNLVDENRRFIRSLVFLVAHLLCVSFYQLFFFTLSRHRKL
jgi:uncharacterized coiled-coil DUF342 family protein